MGHTSVGSAGGGGCDWVELLPGTVSSEATSPLSWEYMLHLETLGICLMKVSIGANRSTELPLSAGKG